jgi:pyruvate/2-oxoglutarate dehydrogenase complex dihydrolipoamide dehydrogenase (E3) component
VVGAGQAGPPLAERLTGAGMTVALIERGRFGGTCVNTGCTPTKTLVASAYAAHLARRAAEYGVTIEGPVRVDFARVQERAAVVAGRSRANVEKWLRGMSGCTVINGHARFEAPDTLRVGEELLQAPRVFLDVGGRARIPKLPGVEDVPFLTNSSLLTLETLPRHLVVVGGGYVGLEFTQMFRRFGSEVTLIEMSERLLRREDEDVAEAVVSILEGEGVRVRTRAECIRLARAPEGVRVHVDCKSGEPDVVGSHVLLAVGRTPNTHDLGLDRAGVVTDAHGYIEVDDALQSNVPGIWALGDCNGRGAFTHTSYNDFEIVAANLLDGERRSVKDRLPAYALYIDPPLGRVGMSESEARESGRPLLVGKRPMTRVSRAVEKGETQGFIKIVADAETQQILGATILGIGGDEAIHGVIDMMHARVPYPVYQWAVPIHPNVSELIPTVLGSMKPIP